MDASLLSDLGGPESVFEIVSEMYERVFQDPELAPFFEHTDAEHLKKMQYEFLVSALGGPVNYSGAELQAAHTGRGIQPAHFSRFVSHFDEVLEERDVDKRTRESIVSQLAMHRDRIVGGANVDG
ncbi:MAG: group I truncated hemoglobin [Aureliella sp.]